MPAPSGQPRERPTGAQWTIGHGSHTAVVTEVGATLRSYTCNGRAALEGFGVDEWSHAGRGQVLAPWPNRLGDGRYTFDDEEIQAPLNEPERANAIHGFVRWMPWQLESAAQNKVGARCLVRPTPAYPFTLLLRLEYRLARHGLSITTTARNVGDRRLPWGVGFHPYLTVGTETVDVAQLRLPARCRLVADGRGLPTGEARAVEGTEYDFRRRRVLGPTRLDTAYSELDRDGDGLARAELADASGTRRTELWVDASFTHLMCFTGDTLGADARRRAVAIEPMSCPPDAFRSGTNLVTLEPGEEWSGTWGLSPG